MSQSAAPNLPQASGTKPTLVEVDFLDLNAEVEAVQKSYVDQAVKEFTKLYPKESQTGNFFKSFVTSYAMRSMVHDIVDLRRLLKEKQVEVNIPGVLDGEMRRLAGGN